MEAQDVSRTDMVRVDRMAVGEHRIHGAEVEVVRVSRGYELAGSRLTWTDGYCAVRWLQGNALQGQRFTRLEDASRYFSRTVNDNWRAV